MLNVTVNYDKQLFKGHGFTRQDMQKIGAKAIQTITERVAQAKGLNDTRMKKLTPPYAKRKSKQGAPPIRNLMLSGAMLGSLNVIEATDQRAVIGFTRQSEAKKAGYNQAIEPWFGLSKKDQRILQEFINRLLKK